jgi:hypothetical protein
MAKKRAHMDAEAGSNPAKLGFETELWLASEVAGLKFGKDVVVEF